MAHNGTSETVCFRGTLRLTSYFGSLEFSAPQLSKSGLGSPLSLTSRCLFDTSVQCPDQNSLTSGDFPDVEHFQSFIHGESNGGKGV